MRTRSNKGKGRASGLSLCVYVKYPLMKVKWLMGKIFSIQRGQERLLIFYHESKDSQSLKVLDSPGGVDKCVLDLLLDYRVREYHHKHKDSQTLYVADLQTIRDKGILRTLGGKTRYFLPYALWREEPSVPYVVPFVTQGKTLFPDEEEEAPVIKKTAEATEPTLFDLR